MDNVSLMVATPMYGGMCSGFYAQSIFNLQIVCQQNSIPLQMAFMFNESLIERARNALANQFMKSNHTHLLWIDADIKFNAIDIIPMLGANVDVICGVYPKKEINWQAVAKANKSGIAAENLKNHTGSFVVNLSGFSSEATVPINQPLEVWYAGTGFMLVRRNVLEALSERVPTYFNDVNDLSGTTPLRDPIKQFYACSIEPETGRLLSEDYHFCKLVRDWGGKIFVAPWVSLGHLGSYLFEGQLTRSG